jgi:hypothetical protein
MAQPEGGRSPRTSDLTSPSALSELITSPSVPSCCMEAKRRDPDGKTVGTMSVSSDIGRNESVSRKGTDRHTKYMTKQTLATYTCEESVSTAGWTM